MTAKFAAIALTRFAMGARPGEIAEISSDPRGWLFEQLKTPYAVQISDKALISAAEAIKNFQTSPPVPRAASPKRKQKDGQKALRSASTREDRQKDPKQIVRQQSRQYLQREIELRSKQAAQTDHSFLERWVRFWSNHFTVAARGARMVPLVGPFEREVIRQYAFTDFATLLEKAVLHQAMIIYLNNDRSFGSASQLSERRKTGLNENLAREILELHTLGVDGGYRQSDVTSFAKTLTGWTISRQTGSITRQSDNASAAGQAVFNPRIHEPGPQIILGQTYPQDGADQAKAVLATLARAPQTARHIAYKLLRHFIADSPPPDAVARLADIFSNSDGDLKELAKALINLDAAWQSDQRKLKTPEELLISAARGLGFSSIYGRNVQASYNALGQKPFSAASPEGWPDTASDWAGSDAIKKRLEWANRIARKRAISVNALDFMDAALGPLATAHSRLIISRAESREQALTIALMSPEFQRR